MTHKKGLVGKDLKPASPGGGAKPGMAKSGSGAGAKPALGSKLPPAKDLPAKTGGSRNLLSVEDVAERLRVDPAHVQLWLKEGLLKGSAQAGVQLYELEKFRAKHHREIQQAQNAPAPTAAPPKAAPKSAKSQGKKASAKVDTPAKATTKKQTAEPAQQPEKKQGGGFSFHIFKQLVSMFFSTSKPEKTAPYVLPDEEPAPRPEGMRAAPPPPPPPPDPEPEMILEDDDAPVPVVAEVLTTSQFHTSQLKGARTGADLEAPPPPSQEVWPSLEKLSAEPSPAPAWLNQPAPGLENETLILRADQIARAQSASPVSGANAGRELQEEKLRNQELLAQLQEQRRAELELQDEIETLKQRLELSLNGEREVRAQLKRSRQELQTALEELDQRPPATGGGDEVRALEERCSQLEAEKSQVEQLKTAAEHQKSLLETQIERLRAQAEEIRQHGLQWHQLASQQDGQLRQLRQQHAELEQEASRALDELEARLQQSDEARLRSESLAQQLQQKVEQLNQELQGRSDAGVAQLQQDVKQKERTIQQLQFQLDQMQSQMLVLETQQRNQTQRWEQELQASASWVQKLTEAVTVRDRRISELEAALAQNAARTPSASEEELKSQVMSLRVELTSLRRNYEIVSLQAKNLENQLQESRRAAPTPSSPPPAPPPTMPPPMLTLDLPISGQPQGAESEGGFRRRLNARLRSLGTTSSEDSKKRGLEPPPFLELDIPDS